MKKIFRSIINIKNPKTGLATIPLEELERNYKAFISSNVKPEDPSFIKLYHWLEAHYREFKELPSIEFINEKAEGDGDTALLGNIKEIVLQTPYTRSDYKAILKAKFLEQSLENFRAVVQNTWTAANAGFKAPHSKKEIKGIPQALEYFSAEARKFRINTTDAKTESQILSVADANEVLAEYKKRYKDPASNPGLYTFLEKIDDCFRGTRLGQLMIVAAFVGNGKSTFVANLAWNAVYSGLNGLYMTLEMPFAEMRDMIYTIHCSAPDWFDHPKYKHIAGKIAFEKVLYGELNDQEYEFFEMAAKDFCSHQDYGQLILANPEDTLTPSRLEMEIMDRQAELAEQGRQLDFLIVDYVGLMVQDKNERYGDFRTDFNAILKRLKNLSLNFNNGRGLRVILPFQINREGWKEANKNDGIYKLTALSDANEAERSPDQIISLYTTPDMKKTGLVKICCLKHRKGAEFAPFEAHFDFSTRKISDFIQSKDSTPQSDMSIELLDGSIT